MQKSSKAFGLIITAITFAALMSALLSMAKSNQEPTRTELFLAPPMQPKIMQQGRDGQPNFIGAAGVVEPSSEEISIGTQTSGAVTNIFVKPNQVVEKGDPLFSLDQRLSIATIVEKRSDVAAAVAGLAQARARVPGLEAKLKMARTEIEAATADRDEAGDMVEIATRLAARAVITTRERTRRRNIHRRLQARLRAAQAGFEKAMADLRLYQEAEDGASLHIAKTAVQQANAALKRAQVELSLKTVRAPMAGTVLKVNTRPGEYAKSGNKEDALIVLGRLTPLHVRVDVDEIDVPRWKPTFPATALIRGQPKRVFKLKFVRREPLVVPKKSLSGASDERVDTRVMQVIYEVDREKIDMLVGQQMDIFIQMVDEKWKVGSASHSSIGAESIP